MIDPADATAAVFSTTPDRRISILLLCSGEHWTGSSFEAKSSHRCSWDGPQVPRVASWGTLILAAVIDKCQLTQGRYWEKYLGGVSPQPLVFRYNWYLNELNSKQPKLCLLAINMHRYIDRCGSAITVMYVHSVGDNPLISKQRICVSF